MTIIIHIFFLLIIIIIRVLLISNSVCIFQAKFLYKVPFSTDERQTLKHMIQGNLYRYIGILLEERERFEVEAINEMRIKSINQPGPSGTKKYHSSIAFAVQFSYVYDIFQSRTYKANLNSSFFNQRTSHITH